MQLILTGDIDIDAYSQNELKYYYHPNSESGDIIKDGPGFAVRNVGKFGDQNVVIAYFNEDIYSIKLTSNKTQMSQIGIMKENDLQTLSDFNIEEGDIVEIKYSPDKVCVYYNNKKIGFDGDDTLNSEDISIVSLDTNMEDNGNTIAARIKLKNCSDISIPLNEIVFSYIFNPDGHDNNIAEFDWACNDNINITNTVVGKFHSLDDNNMQFNISFDNTEVQVLEVGKELEIHFRIHTTDWQNYVLTNDYSRNTSKYSTNQRILLYYKDALVWGDEYINEND